MSASPTPVQFATAGLARLALEAVDGPAVVLDSERRVIAVNELAREELGVEIEAPAVHGVCLGHLARCDAVADPEQCATCGGCAVPGILERALDDGEARGEVLLTSAMPAGPVAREWAARAIRYDEEGATRVLLILRDLSDTKRRAVLERVFVRDLQNTVGGLRGWGSALRHFGADPQEAGERIERLTARLLDEIEGHRALLDAEQGNLEVRLEPVRVADMLDRVATLFAAHPLVRDRELRLQPGRGMVLADRGLAVRVLTNLVKNALEAMEPGQTAVVEATPRGDHVALSVTNPGDIPGDVAALVFRRSFSTKGAGRGLGTWSARLLGERYLGGRVGFTTGEGRTTFTLSLPAVSPLRPLG